MSSSTRSRSSSDNSSARDCFAADSPAKGSELSPGSSLMATIMRRNPPGASEQFCPNRAGYEIIARSDFKPGGRESSCLMSYLTGKDRMGNTLLQRAAHQRPATSKRGVLEPLCTLMFKGFVYNQIWEDPAVDLEALRLGPQHRLITIASAGCNVLNYLVAGPERIIAVDLNPNHIALTRLKLQALEHLADHDAFFRFFGIAKDKANRKLFDNFLTVRLDPQTRRYLERRMPLQDRRSNMIARNLYRYGLIG